jgi:arsenate reductase-like glutaredoxin family protein
MLNPSRDLIIAAMSDEKLFREVLLNNLILGRPITRRGKQLLNSWALVSLTDRGLPLITTSEEDEE